MKRFILFEWDHETHTWSGGYFDCVDSYETIEEAFQNVTDTFDESFHILDFETGQLVA
jgi:hypothetical protein